MAEVKTKSSHALILVVILVMIGVLSGSYLIFFLNVERTTVLSSTQNWTEDHAYALELSTMEKRMGMQRSYFIEAKLFRNGQLIKTHFHPMGSMETEAEFPANLLSTERSQILFSVDENWCEYPLSESQAAQIMLERRPNAEYRSVRLLDRSSQP